MSRRRPDLSAGSGSEGGRKERSSSSSFAPLSPAGGSPQRARCGSRGSPAQSGGAAGAGSADTAADGTGAGECTSAVFSSWDVRSGAVGCLMAFTSGGTKRVRGAAPGRRRAQGAAGKSSSATMADPRSAVTKGGGKEPYRPLREPRGASVADEDRMRRRSGRRKRTKVTPLRAREVGETPDRPRPRPRRRRHRHPPQPRGRASRR